MHVAAVTYLVSSREGVEVSAILGELEFPEVEDIAHVVADFFPNLVIIYIILIHIPLYK